MAQMDWSFITVLYGSMGGRQKFMACSEYVSSTLVTIMLLTWYFQDEQIYFSDALALRHVVTINQSIFRETDLFTEYV